MLHEFSKSVGEHIRESLTPWYIVTTINFHFIKVWETRALCQQKGSRVEQHLVSKLLSWSDQIQSKYLHYTLALPKVHFVPFFILLSCLSWFRGRNGTSSSETRTEIQRVVQSTIRDDDKAASAAPVLHAATVLCSDSGVLTATALLDWLLRYRDNALPGVPIEWFY